MKKINSSQMNVDSVYSPLDELVNIESVDNRLLEQWYYVNANVYYPDRKTSPLVLRPTIKVTDGDSGTSYTPTITAADWSYRKEGQTAWTVITNTTSGQDKDFTKLSNGRLEVRASYTAELRCELTYADPRNLQYIQTSAETKIVTNTDAESVYNVHIITTETGYEYSPLTENSSQKTFKAIATLGIHDVTDDVNTNGLFQWYTVMDGSEVLIDAADPAYVSGQGTKTLVLDALFSTDYPIILRMKRDRQAGTALEPCRDQAHMLWRVPTLKSEIVSPQGDAIKTGTTGYMEFKPIFHTNIGNDVSDEKVRENLIIKWSRRNSAGAFSAVGYGPSIFQDVSVLRTNGQTSTLMQSEAYLRGPYCTVTQEGYEPETRNVVSDNDNSILITQTVNGVEYQVVQDVLVKKTFIVVQDGKTVVERN